MCRVLEVSVHGFHTWRRRPLAKHHQQDEQLKITIQSLFNKHKGNYGVPRIHAQLSKDGCHHSKKRIARLMSDLGLYGKTRRRFVKTTTTDKTHPVAENKLNRQFNPEGPNKVWASDMTYIPTREGWLYLGITMDLYSRSIVGWAMDKEMPATLPLEALKMAIQGQKTEAGLLHHSDRGSQYTSSLFQNYLKQNQIECSMSRKGECWDNAVVESFFETLKRELIEGVAYYTREEAQRAIFEYIEVYYNRKRLHSTLGYLTPWEVQMQARVA